MSGCHIVKRQFWLHLGQFLLNFVRIKIVYTRRVFQLKWSTSIPSFVFLQKQHDCFPPSTNTNLSRCLGFGKFQPSCPFVGSFINVYSGNYERKITIIYRGLAWKRCSRGVGGGGGGLKGDTTYVTHTCYYKNNKKIILPPPPPTETVWLRG